MPSSSEPPQPPRDRAAGAIARAVTRRLAHLHTPRRPKAPPGSTPGIESIANLDDPPAAGSVFIRCIDYGPDLIVESEPATVDALLAAPRPSGAAVRWLNVDGLHPHVANRLRQKYHFHTLAAEDVLRVPQRPKVEEFEGHLFIVARMPMLLEGRLCLEQVSLFLFPGLVLTFQETIGDVWDPLRQRLRKSGSRLRVLDASYLLYALLDSTVDQCFPILEHYGQVLDALEDEVVARPTPLLQQRIHRVKRELGRIRRVIWPMREVVNFLQRPETDAIAPDVKAYMRDVYDHTVQVMDVVESYREVAAGLNDLYMSAVSNRTNEIMKVLTIMASFFIPITFVAGVYGMNFEDLPEIHWPHGYLFFWLVILTIVGAMTTFFVRQGWIGGGRRPADDSDDPDHDPTGGKRS